MTIAAIKFTAAPFEFFSFFDFSKIMMNALLDITPAISVVSIILEVTAAHAKWALLSVKITTHVQVRGISFKGITLWR